MTFETPRITAQVTFLSHADGGRVTLPQFPWGVYRPHVVVAGSDEYLGVCFVSGPTPFAGEAGSYELDLVYHPQVDYSALTPGAQFSIREGSRVVATGHVIGRYT